MKIKFIISVLISFTILFSGSANLWASEVDVLIEKLVEKNILTESEAKELVGEIKKEGKKTKKSSASWAGKIKLKGDVRLRYQTEDKGNDGKVSRDRYRARARVGIIAKPNDKWEAGIGLATGGTDPRSTNETLDNTFETSDMRMDYAYAKFSPNKMISLMGGKIKNPIWGTKDLLWDGDINPDGFAAKFKFKITDNLEIFVTPAYFILEEYKTSKDDPSMIALQPGISWKVNDTVKLKIATTYYNFSDVKGNDFSKATAGLYGAGTNTVDVYGGLMYEYDPLAFDAEVGFKISDSMSASIFGQYVDSDAASNNKGSLYGFKVGGKSVIGLKSWQIKINYRKLEKDAWLDFLPDSDFYGGATDVKGMEYELKLGLSKKVSMGIDYYHSKPILGDTDVKQDVFQADLIVKF